MTRLPLVALTMLTCAAIIGTAAGATDVYMNETGWWRAGGAFNADDTPVQAAADVVNVGEIIIGWNGSYTENMDINRRLTLKGEDVGVVTVTAATSNPSAESAQSSTHINFGETISGSIDPSSEVDTYTFSAHASDTVVIRIDGPSAHNDLNPKIRLYAPNGTLLTSQWSYNNLEILHTLPDNGEYNILLCDHGIEYIGNYNMFVDMLFATRGDLNYDGILTPADAAIALRIAASGAHDDAADVSRDGRVTSLDALMILQAATDTIEL